MLGRKKILLVDDEFALRHILKTILAQVGDFEFLEAANGSQALDMMHKHKPDLVFLDVFMPVLSGVDTLKQMHDMEDLKDIPVIMCTAESKINTVRVSLELGAKDYIVKPFNMETVKNKAQKWLGLGE